MVYGGGENRGAGSVTRSSGGQEETEVIVERKGNGTQEPRKLCFVTLLKEQLRHEGAPVSEVPLKKKRVLEPSNLSSNKSLRFDVIICCCRISQRNAGSLSSGVRIQVTGKQWMHPLHINFSVGIGLSVPVPRTATGNKLLFLKRWELRYSQGK